MENRRQILKKGVYVQLFLCTVLLFSHSIVYSKVLMRAADTDFVEFSAYAQTESIKTFAQYQWDQIRNSLPPVQLESLLTRAQSEFLSDSPESAKMTYQAVVNHTHAFDWDTEERKIIFYSFLRLAQLETEEQRSKLLLKKAVVFGKNLKVDLSLFPPPLVKAYHQIKESIHLISFDLRNIFPNHEWILINGAGYSHDQQVSLPDGTYRITALSSSHKAWTQIISLAQLVTKKIQTPLLVAGQCEKALLSSSLGKKIGHRIQVLFPHFCVWDINKPVSLDLKPTGVQELMDNNNSNQKITLNKWFWLGIAATLVVATVVVMDFEDKNGDSPSSGSPESSPVISVGF